LLDRRRPGEYFGETALVQAAPRNATIRAGDRPVRLLPISSNLFDRLLKESANFRHEMEQVAAARSQHLACGDEQ
jgi:CRP-like cAMP-binding protein